MPTSSAPTRSTGSGTVHLTLPWAVLYSVNRRTNPAGWGKMKGRQFLTKRYRESLGTAAMLVAAQTRDVEPFAGPVLMRLRFWPPDARRRDVSNLVKLIEDSLVGAVYADDSQIEEQAWKRMAIDRQVPRVEIEVEPINEGGGA